MASDVIHIQAIRVIRVQHIPRGKFDGTRIARITRIHGKRCHSHSGYSGNSRSIFTTLNIRTEHEFH